MRWNASGAAPSEPSSATTSPGCARSAAPAPSPPSRFAPRFLVNARRLSIDVADGVLAVLLSPACAACGRALARPAREVVCGDCWLDVVRLTPPLCTRCGDALASWRASDVGGGICARCRRHPPSALDGRRAAGPYQGRLRDIIHAWKYGQRRSIADPLATLVREAAADLLDASDAVVPVPLHRARRRARGFNQADDLAVRLGLPVLRALRRVRATRPQFELTAAARRRNVRHAFALAPAPLRDAIRAAPSPRHAVLAIGRRARLRLTRRQVDGRRLLLVDDVCTTGATLEACAEVLREAGAASVRAVTAARAAIGRRR